MPYLLAITILVLPLYIWRFSLAVLPTNFLMLWVLGVWVIFKFEMWRRKEVGNFFRILRTVPRPAAVAILLFGLSGIISLFVGGINQAKLGQFIVWFLEPLGLFLVTYYYAHQNADTRRVITAALYIFLVAAGIVSIIQYFTLHGLPMAWWGNANEPKRALGLFNHPDGFGLFLAPVLAYVLPDWWERVKNWRTTSGIYITAGVLGVIGLLLCLSRGAWFGFGAAALIFVVFAGSKRLWGIAAAGVVVVALIVAVTPVLRYRLILPFKGEKSSVARLSLWHTGAKMIRDNPIFGKGLDGFNENWYRYNTDTNLDHYNFPHNIFLNFWVDTGLLGMISFTVLLFYGIIRGLGNRKIPHQFALALFLIALVVHGLIDIPYFKNDLASLFWMVLAIGL